MSCCRNECAYLAVIIGIIAGVILGVLYSLGFVATGIIFWAYLAIGIAGVFLSPIYAFLDNVCREGNCFCSNKIILLVAVVGAIITGLLLAFFTLTLTSVVCIIKCISGCTGITD